MIPGLKYRRFVVAQLLIGGLLTLLVTYVSLVIADDPTTPQSVRYVFSPGYVLGVRFVSGEGFLDTLGSFGCIAITANLIYFGSITFLLLCKINWPKIPRNRRHCLWMEP